MHSSWLELTVQVSQLLIEEQSGTQVPPASTYRVSQEEQLVREEQLRQPEEHCWQALVFPT